MIRSLTLALLGLTLTVGPALATTRGETTPSQQPAATMAQADAVRQVQGNKRSARRSQGPSHGARRAAPVRGQYSVSRDWRAATASSPCTRSRGVTRCGGQALSWSSGAWARGLEPAANIQANECPAGTMATLARGHDDVVRCMPI